MTTALFAGGNAGQERLDTTASRRRPLPAGGSAGKTRGLQRRRGPPRRPGGRGPAAGAGRAALSSEPRSRRRGPAARHRARPTWAGFPPSCHPPTPRHANMPSSARNRTASRAFMRPRLRSSVCPALFPGADRCRLSRPAVPPSAGPLAAKNLSSTCWTPVPSRRRGRRAAWSSAAWHCRGPRDLARGPIGVEGDRPRALHQPDRARVLQVGACLPEEPIA